MQLVIISGCSGAGKSQAASILEDSGFYCVDNLPPTLIPQFVRLCLATQSQYEKVALVTDVRSGVMFDSLFAALAELDRLQQKRNELRNKELLKAIETSDRSYDEIIAFLKNED